MSDRTYIKLPSRKRLDFLAINHRAFDLWEIAEALSHLCRFTGHTRGRLWTVAHHSLLVRNLCPARPFEALWHDAHEVYVGDVSTPLKEAIGEVARQCGCTVNPYRLIEDRVAAELRIRVGLRPDIHPDVKAADRLAYEIEDAWLYPAEGEAEGVWHPALDELSAMPYETAAVVWFESALEHLERKGITL